MRPSCTAPSSWALPIGLALAALPSSAAAQGQYVESTAYFYASMGATPSGSACSGQLGLETSVGFGTLAIAEEGFYILDGDEHRACPFGSTTNAATFEFGDWSLESDGQLTLDADPAMPFTDFTVHRIRFDQSLVYSNNATPERVEMFVAVRPPSGPTTQPSGTFGIARLTQQQNSGSYELVSEQGTLTFDGAGGWTEIGQRHEVALGGAVDSGYSASGTVSVSAGTGLTLSNGAQGTVSDDGEVVILVSGLAGATSPDVSIAVGVRLGEDYTATELLRSWRVVGPRGLPGAGLNPALAADIGLMDVDDAAGTYSNVGGTAVLTQQGLAPGFLMESGSFLLGPGGGLVLDRFGSTPLTGALSSDESVAVAADVLDPGSAGIRLIVRECEPTVPYGSGSAGTGGIAPHLSSSGGLPLGGNTGFGFEVTDAVGGSSALFIVSLEPAPGIPFQGGELLVDLTKNVFLTGLALGGASGAPGAGAGSLPVAIPTGHDGVDLYAQAFVLDAGSPTGAALTNGLALKICAP